MTDLIVPLFLIAHGLVHLGIYVTPQDPSKPAPFDPARSWALAAQGVDVASMRAASVALAVATAAAFTAAGFMVMIGGGSTAAVAAAVLGLSLKSLWFHPWLLVGIAIDLSLLAAVLGGSWP
jgi:hypothetical protein